MQAVCRSCMRRDALRPLVPFSSAALNYAALTGIQIDDSNEFPNWMCAQCLFYVFKFVSFRDRSLKCQDIFRNRLKNCRKELIDDVTRSELKTYGLSLERSETLILDSAHPIECSVSAFDFKHELDEFSDQNEQDAELPVDEDPFNDENAGPSPETSEGNRRDAERTSIDEDEPFAHYDDELSASDSPRRVKKTKKVKVSKRKKKRLGKPQRSNPESSVKSEFNSRMVLETEQYKVIKLTREQLLEEMTENEKSERYRNAPYKCQLCVKGFNYEDVLQNHMTKHEPKNGVYECDVCHQFLPSAVSMRGHKKSHSTKYQCKKCGVIKASRQHLLEHFMLVHEGSPRTYVCNVCGKTLTRRTMFQKHMRIHYPSNKITCDKCGKLFKTIETLRAHMLRHEDFKRYSCDQCSKTFRYASLLYTHKVTHITTKNYYCVECDMRFKTESNLRLHLRKSLKHVDPDSLKYGCEQCERRYDDLKGLQHHVEWVHMGLKNFKCAKCDMRFGSQDGLRSHMKKIHDGIKPPRSHVCEMCNKAFRAKAVLIKHIRVHTGERPYECNECGKKFAQNSTMSTHIKLVHLKMQRHVKKNTSIVKKDPVQPVPSLSSYQEIPVEHEPYIYPAPSNSDMRQMPLIPYR